MIFSYAWIPINFASVSLAKSDIANNKRSIEHPVIHCPMTCHKDFKNPDEHGHFYYLAGISCYQHLSEPTQPGCL